MEKDRRDRCKCGKFFYWSTEESIVECPKCKTKFRVDCDSIFVYWLEEIIKSPVPYKTDPR